MDTPLCSIRRSHNSPTSPDTESSDDSPQTTKRLSKDSRKKHKKRKKKGLSADDAPLLVPSFLFLCLVVFFAAIECCL